MNGLDFALVILLAACALRGYWRGFIREGFGLIAIVLGIVAAARLSEGATAAIDYHLSLPPTVESAGVFVGIFVIVHSALNAAGAVVDRFIGGITVRMANRVTGAAFGAGKAAIVLGFGLLVLHLFPVVPTLDAQLVNSTIARPLVAAASDAVRVHPQDDASGSSRRM